MNRDNKQQLVNELAQKLGSAKAAFLADYRGLNVEQVKDDWPFLFGTMVEETYHRLQIELFPALQDSPVRLLSSTVITGSSSVLGVELKTIG